MCVCVCVGVLVMCNMYTVTRVGVCVFCNSVGVCMCGCFGNV